MWEKNNHPKNYMDVKVDANQCYTVKHGLKSP